MLQVLKNIVDVLFHFLLFIFAGEYLQGWL